MEQEELIQKVIETESRSKSNTHRLDELKAQGEALMQLTKTVAALVERMDTNTKSVDRLTARMDAVEGRPAGHWQRMIDAAVAAVIGIIVTLLLTGRI